MTGQAVAIVTGAASGIGRAAALALARAGYGIICADVDESGVKTVAREIEQLGRAACVVVGDVSREEFWPPAVEAAARLGTLGVLVSNAGIFPRIAFETALAMDLDRIFAVNLRAAFLGSAACVPVMRTAGGGSLVFMTSGSGLAAAAANPFQRGFALYGASKAALDRWVMGVAPELAPLGIAANLLCPGAAVRTEGFERLNLGPEAPPATISPGRVAEAIVRLAERRPPDTGSRFVASELVGAEGSSAV